MLKLKISIFLILLTNLLFAGELVKKYALVIDSQEWIKLEFSEPHSSFVLRSNESMKGIEVEFDGGVISLENDPHAPNYTSQLFFPESGLIHSLRVRSLEPVNLEIFGLSVPVLNLTLPKMSKLLADSCKKPAGIDQSVWRAGLPLPAPNPSLNAVSHCIIHHSAGSNTATDYTEVVRNIYVYHTSVNGWDDIGYNYLIAQDGTLFHGRDGQGLIEDDNVRGAHYCGKNSGTMGVCLLGNYMTILPPQAALDKLEDLLLWKLNKESLDPLDSARHPLPGGAFLPTIAGHQDGCATDCPGTFLYALLPSVIDSVSQRIGNCLPYTSLPEMEKNELSVYPNPASDWINIHSLEQGNLVIYDLNGVIRCESGIDSQNTQISAIDLKAGVYILVLQTPDRVLKRKLIISR